jgi:hypothetical protein
MPRHHDLIVSTPVNPVNNAGPAAYQRSVEAISATPDALDYFDAAYSKLFDEWLAAHPEAPRLPHLEDTEESSTVETPSAEAAASVGVTDPGSLTPPAATASGA